MHELIWPRNCHKIFAMSRGIMNGGYAMDGMLVLNQKDRQVARAWLT